MVNSKNPQNSSIKFCDDGIYFLSRNKKKTWIANPILVTAFATSDERTQHEQAFTVIKFLTRRGKWKKEIVPSSMLTGQKHFIALLSDRGYLWPPNKKLWSKIIQALSIVDPGSHVCTTDVPGWHRGSIVLPDESYTPKGPNRKKFLLKYNPTVQLGKFRRSGTIEQWKKIAKLCCHSSRGRCVVAAVFTAPNLRPLKIGTFGLNLSGETSSAKTFLLSLAASAAGLNSSDGPETWDGSATAFEQRALGHRDSIMLLDDLGHLAGNPTETAKLVTFRLASNRPKAKAGQYVRANNLVDKDFRIIPLSTSEDPIWEQLNGQKRGGRRVRGEEVRMINLRACTSDRGDVFDGQGADAYIGQTIEDRSNTIERYTKLAVKYQGEVYRAYLAKRSADKGALETLQKYMADYVKAAPLPEQYRWLRRISRYFAAMSASAAQAIDYGVLPWGKKSTLAAIRDCMYDAMDQLVASFKTGSSIGTPQIKSDQTQLRDFKKLVDGANFIRINRKTRKTGLTKKLKTADGIVRRDKSGTARAFLFSKTLDRWHPDAATRKDLTKLLRSLRIFGKGRRADTGTREIFATELGGKVPCYALSRKRLCRSFQRAHRSA